MNYYKIQIAYSATIIKLEKPSKYYNPNTDKTEIINYCAQIKDHIKPIDVIKVAKLPFGYMVSDKLKNILEQFKLPPYQFYPIPLEINTTLLDYYWFHVHYTSNNKSKDANLILDYIQEDEAILISEKLMAVFKKENVSGFTTVV